VVDRRNGPNAPLMLCHLTLHSHLIWIVALICNLLWPRLCWQMWCKQRLVKLFGDWVCPSYAFARDILLKDQRHLKQSWVSS
jgi:hypothetical protein